jgi:hypothetical protein
VVGDLGLEVLDTAGVGAHRVAGAALIDWPGGTVAEPGTAGHQLRGGETTQLAAELRGSRKCRFQDWCEATQRRDTERAVLGRSLVVSPIVGSRPAPLHRDSGRARE